MPPSVSALGRSRSSIRCGRLQAPQQSTLLRCTTRHHLNTSHTERQPPPYRTRTSELNPTLHRDSTIATRTDRRCAILDDPRGPGRPGRLAQRRRRRVCRGTGRQRRRRSRPAGNRRASTRRRPTRPARAWSLCARGVRAVAGRGAPGWALARAGAQGRRRGGGGGEGFCLEVRLRTFQAGR